jgi:hypothetical protein
VNIANRIIRGFARGSCGGLPPWPPSWLGELSDHPKLSEALRACCKLKATLVIAKLDRLARNVQFISGARVTPRGNVPGTLAVLHGVIDGGAALALDRVAVGVHLLNDEQLAVKLAH